MTTRKILSAFLSGFLFTAQCFGSPALSDLIKVTKESNPKCVEYYIYKGESYCSTKAFSSQKIDPALKDYEKQNIVFDDRAWQAAWGKKTPTFTSVEYIPMGEDINNWKELVTSQFFPNLNVSPSEFANKVIERIKSLGLNPIITFHQNTSDKVIFEFRIEAPSNQVQDELQMVTRGKDGLYVLHYVIKEPSMSLKRREKWLKNFSKSSIK